MDSRTWWFSNWVNVTFSFRLVPLLKSMYDETLVAGGLPPTLTQATITLILKKDKRPLNCSSYRPISLLCCDYKILNKTLANQLILMYKCWYQIIQTGFIPAWQPFFNLRQLLNIMYSTHSSKQPEVILSLDAEKAFNRIEWVYLHAVLKRFGFGEAFRNWIQILYSSPMSTVKTNGLLSAYFPLYKGMRQGCCLSPFLFSMAIEPL